MLPAAATLMVLQLNTHECCDGCSTAKITAAYSMLNWGLPSLQLHTNLLVSLCTQQHRQCYQQINVVGHIMGATAGHGTPTTLGQVPAPAPCLQPPVAV